MAERACLRAVVVGRVQGVFFRDFVRKQAEALGLSGYVRNRADFRELELVAEGERKQLEALLERVRVGPRGARVERVEADWSAFEGKFHGFEIRYA